jgi:predicted nuclease with TOPRIM domain|tara:strand:+ start:70 stop:354 length:285 start_codon:yes stop_codon:yes gene_type:complete
MAKKSKDVKFTKDELNSIEELRNNYNSVTNALGMLEVSRMQTEKRLETIEGDKIRLETQYEQLTMVEKELINSLTEKYGQGSIDINSGVFTPVK